MMMMINDYDYEDNHNDDNNDDVNYDAPGKLQNTVFVVNLFVNML